MANKPVLIAAAVVLLLSVGSLAVAGAAISSVEEDFEKITPSNYLTETSTSHEIKYVDDDGLGSAGFYILIEGETTDENQDGLVDACVEFEFTVMDGSSNVTEQTSEVDCTRYGTTQLDGEFPDEGFIAVAKICDTYDDEGNGSEDVESCDIGTVYSVQANTGMMVFDSDSYYVDILGELGDFLGDLFGGSCFGIIGLCCGVILLIVGLIMGGQQQPPVMMGGMPTGQIPTMGYQAPVGQMPQQQVQAPIQQTMPQGQVVPNAQMTQQPAEQQPQSNVWDQS